MSAIAGIIQFDGRSVDRATLERMQTLLTPYGKDTQNRWHQGTVAMLRTLLRTTPEDSFDRQPLVHAPSDITLVFDGRIDNRDELAEALGLTTADINLMADSDLVLLACLKWDTQVVDHLLGDFALACWQASRHRLWLARDPLGVRPLFWHQQPGFFAFASMPKALFAVPGIPRALCEDRLHDYLCLLPMTGPESFFKDIYRVEPGHVVVLEDERVTSHRYHEFDPHREIRLPSDGDYVEAVREQLNRAVACRLRTNGPVASHLSSGFDSSTVTAIAASQLAKQNKQLLAYTAAPREGFNAPVIKTWHADESQGATALASRFTNIEHILIRSGSQSPIDSLAEDVEKLDRAPLNICNMVWLNAIQTDAAQRGVKVMLTGSRGNMTISYDGAPYLPALLGRGQWLTLWRELKAIKKRYPNWRWRALLEHCIFPYLPPPVWLAIEKRRGRGLRKFTDYTAINPQFMNQMRSLERAKKIGWDLSYRPWANGRRMRIAAFNRYDNGEYQAGANVAGLEVRDPTADLRLIKFCLSVPDSQYLGQGQPRWLLHRLMGDVLPPQILHAHTKGLQAADWFEGVNEALPQIRQEITQLMNHERVKGYLDVETLQKDLDAWPVSGWETHAVDQKYRYKLLRGLSIGAFVRYIDDANV
jgi:asparagine synthase (glutamine-hydrolysing)